MTQSDQTQDKQSSRVKYVVTAILTVERLEGKANTWTGRPTQKTIISGLPFCAEFGSKCKRREGRLLFSWDFLVK